MREVFQKIWKVFETFAIRGRAPPPLPSIDTFYIISFICETDFTLLVPIKHIIVIIFDVDWFVNKGRNGAAEDKAS